MMFALVKETKGPGLSMRKVPKPVPQRGEVLVKIRKTAICGTDLHIYNWDHWSEENIRPPMIIGHEFVGEIAELGEGVTGWEVGQRVSAEGHIICGRCRNCRSGNGQFCPNTVGIGVNRDGIFAQYCAIPAGNLCYVPEGIPDDIVSFFDAYGNATHTALMFDVVGEDVLITGAGPIGIMAAAICKKNGARRVVITDVNEYRLELARKMGATSAVNVAKEDLRAVMKEQGLVEGFDVGLEMSGNAAAFNQMLSAMRNGGKIALLGIAGKGTVIDWNDVIFKGLTLQGIYGRKIFETWYKMQAMIEAGLDLDPIITHRFDAREYEKGFEAMASGQSGKVILDWTQL